MKSLRGNDRVVAPLRGKKIRKVMTHHKAEENRIEGGSVRHRPIRGKLSRRNR